MKQFVAVVLGVLLLSGIAFAADDILSNLPTTRTGIALDMNAGKYDLLSITTCDLLTYKKLITLGAGVVTEVNEEAKGLPAVTASIELGGLQRFGIDTPITNLVNVSVGVFAARDFTERENDLGVQATILKLAF